MSQSVKNQLQSLQDAIMQRARELAQEIEEKTSRQCDTILSDVAVRIHMSEEREVLAAKLEAERHFHRVTQSSELKMKGRIDQLRWELVQTIQSRLTKRMQALCADRLAYREWLLEMVRDAASVLPEGDLVAEVNADDLSWLSSEWPELAAIAAPGRNITLSEKATSGSGGIRLRTTDNLAQVDNRFEGRLARYQSELQRVILRTLFPADINASARSGGVL